MLAGAKMASMVDVDLVAQHVDAVKHELDCILQNLRRCREDLVEAEESNWSERQALESEKELLHHEREQFAWEAAQVADHNARSHDIVKLSIGGERLVDVRRGTLTQVEGSMLGAMFSGRHQLETDDLGRVFLDRDPKYFDYVLNHLRNGCPMPAHLPADEEDQFHVRQEFNYFLLPVDAPVTPTLVKLIASDECPRHELTLPNDLKAYRVYSAVMTDRYAAIVADKCPDQEFDSVVAVWDLETQSKFVLNHVTPSMEPGPLAVRDNTLIFVDVNVGELHVCDLSASGTVSRRVSISGGASVTNTYPVISDTHVAVSWNLDEDDTPIQRITVWDRKTWRRTLEVKNGSVPSSIDLWRDLLLYKSCTGPLVLRSAVTGEIEQEIAVPAVDAMFTMVRFLGTAQRIGFASFAGFGVQDCLCIDEVRPGVWASIPVDLGSAPEHTPWRLRCSAGLFVACAVRRSGTTVQLIDGATHERAVLDVRDELDNMTASNSGLLLCSAAPDSGGNLTFTLYHAAKSGW